MLKNKDGGKELAAEPMPGALRSDPNVATGVSIHVGGIYPNPAGSSHLYTTGSEGCFTVPGGDSQIKALGQDLHSRLDANKKAGTGTNIDITVEKRTDVQKTFQTTTNN